MSRREQIISGIIVDETATFNLSELCESSGANAEWIIELVEHGVLEPQGEQQRQWTFAAIDLRRVQQAIRLRRDLEINMAGIALAVELLEEVQQLRNKLQEFEKQLDQ